MFAVSFFIIMLGILLLPAFAGAHASTDTAYGRCIDDLGGNPTREQLEGCADILEGYVGDPEAVAAEQNQISESPAPQIANSATPSVVVPPEQVSGFYEEADTTKLEGYLEATEANIDAVHAELLELEQLDPQPEDFIEQHNRLHQDISGLIDEKNRLDWIIEYQGALAASWDNPEERLQQTGDESFAEEVRFQKQCFLIEYLDQLAAVTHKSWTEVGLRSIHAIPQDLTAKFVRKSGAENVFNLTPHQLSLLVPKIRLFKVKFNSLEALLANRNSQEVEFIFDDHMSKETIDNITKGIVGRGTGVGIKTFDWKQQGVNPAEVENNIVAKLAIHFNDITELNKDRGGYKYIDLVLKEHRTIRDTEIFNPNFFLIKVVVGWAIPRQHRTLIPEETIEILEKSQTVMFLDMTYHELDFEQDGTIGLSIKYRAWIESKIEHNEFNVFKTYDLASSDPISLLDKENALEISELSARVRDLTSDRASVLACGADNILYDTSDPEGSPSLQSESHLVGEEVLADLGQLEDDYFSQVEMTPSTQAAGLPNPAEIYHPGVTQEYVTHLDDLILQADAAIAALRRQNIDQAYYSFINKLTEYGRIHKVYVSPGQAIGVDTTQLRLGHTREALEATQADQPSGLAFNSAPYVITTEENSEDEPLIRQRRARLRSEGMGFQPIEIRDGTIGNSSTENSLNEVRSLSEGDESSMVLAGLSSALSSEVDVHEERMSQWAAEMMSAVTTVRADGAIPIEYFLFGDLVGVAMESVGKEVFDRNNISVFLGSIEWYNPATRRIVPVPMADIPISVELFSVWFLKNIIQPGVRALPFRNFVNMIFDSLLRTAMGPDCFSTDSLMRDIGNTRYDITTEMYAVQKSYINAISSPHRHLAIGNIPEQVSIQDPNLPHSEYENVLLFQSLLSNDLYELRTIEITGDESYEDIISRDFTNGVYHLNIGSDKGLVKSINYKKIDQPFVFESRLMSSGDLSGLHQLRQRYNADVSLYGNTYFKPGMMVFLNPSMVGFNVDAMKGMAHDLGIGGYFRVITVQNTIQANTGIYEASLDCVWDHSGFSADEDADYAADTLGGCPVSIGAGGLNVRAYEWATARAALVRRDMASYREYSQVAQEYQNQVLAERSAREAAASVIGTTAEMHQQQAAVESYQEFEETPESVLGDYF